MDYNFYKKEPTDKIYWVDNAIDCVGEHLFSFDKERIYNIFADYPHNLTKKQKELFDKENPFWIEFFSSDE